MLLPCVQICTLGTCSKGMIQSRVCLIQGIVIDALLIKLLLQASAYMLTLNICEVLQIQHHGQVLGV